MRADYLINVCIDMAGLFLGAVLILSLSNDKPWDRQKIALMISQSQPHFLYNVLTTITSRRVKNGYEVVIEDDGVGFNPQAPKPDDGRSHVVMVNVKTRLEHMYHAEVTVISRRGKWQSTLCSAAPRQERRGRS